MRWTTVTLESTAITHKHCRHAIEQRADDDQHHALRTLQESDFALGDGVLGARPRVTDHYRSRHHDGGQHDIEEAIDAGVVDQQADVQRQVRVAVEDGIEEAAEARHLVGGARHAAVHHIEDRGAGHDHAGPAETARGEQPRRPDIDQQPEKRQHVGVDLRQREPAHDAIDDRTEEQTDRARTCHSH